MHKIRLRERETHIEMPSIEIAPPANLDSWSMRVRCAPGVALVHMLPERKRFGNLLLPDTAGARCRADFGWVIASGDDRYQVGQCLGIRPYVGLHFIRLSFDSVALDPEPWQGIRMRPGWVAVVPDQPDDEPILRPSSRQSQTGIIVAAHPSSPWPIGARVVFSRRNMVGQYGLGTERLPHDGLKGAHLLPMASVLAELLPGAELMESARFLGPALELSSQICLRLEDETWAPSVGWVGVEPVQQPSPVLASRTVSPEHRCVVYKITQPGNSQFQVGQRVVVHSGSRRVLSLGLGSMTNDRLVWADDIWMVLV